jgi:hypothetical protein
LAAKLIDFLSKNPTFEVEATGVTAANGTIIRSAALAAQSSVMDAEQALKNAGIARQPVWNTLVADVRGVIKNLASCLTKSDTRWLAFGLQMPATKTTPAKPTGLVAQLDTATGGIILTCEPPPLAERFRWRGRAAGSGMPFELMARSTEPTARTKPVAAGTTLELMVQAVNGGAQSVPSDSILFTVPPAATPATTTQPAAKATAELEATALAMPNGNGNGNGNGRTHRTTRVA